MKEGNLFFLLQWALKDLQDGFCEQKALFKGQPLRCSESKTLHHQTNIYSHLQRETGGGVYGRGERGGVGAFTRKGGFPSLFSSCNANFFFFFLTILTLHFISALSFSSFKTKRNQKGNRTTRTKTETTN